MRSREAIVQIKMGLVGVGIFCEGIRSRDMSSAV
jgi:hypothetical protein